MTIWGQDEWGQFPPFVGEYEVLGTFNEVLNKKNVLVFSVFFVAIFEAY